MVVYTDHQNLVNDQTCCHESACIQHWVLENLAQSLNTYSIPGPCNVVAEMHEVI
jgi:hypothetical protein